MKSNLTYTELPPRAVKLLEQSQPRLDDAVKSRLAEFANVTPRAPDKDGDTETFHGVTFTHRFVEAPGDYETIRWHYVETGPSDGEPIVFLHGIPDSWFQWYYQMAALAATHRCIAVDLKGYGQSDTKPGDYRHEGAAEQLYVMLRQIGVEQFNLVTHDRGTIQGDFIAAMHPESVLRYGRGEQHLYHFNPKLAPQGEAFRDAPWTGLLEDVNTFIVRGYAWVTKKPIAHDEMVRIIQEFAYPGVTHAVPRYFNSSTFRQEWLARRNYLLAAWTCPVLILQGDNSPTQPWEFFENAKEYIPNSPNVQVRYMPSGHFWPHEVPQETVDAIRHLLTM